MKNFGFEFLASLLLCGVSYFVKKKERQSADEDKDSSN